MKQLNFKVLVTLALFANLSLVQVNAKDGEKDAKPETTSRRVLTESKNSQITGNSQAASVDPLILDLQTSPIPAASQQCATDANCDCCSACVNGACKTVDFDCDCADPDRGLPGILNIEPSNN
jgi:hypothetical protein